MEMINLCGLLTSTELEALVGAEFRKNPKLCLELMENLFEQTPENERHEFVANTLFQSLDSIYCTRMNILRRKGKNPEYVSECEERYDVFVERVNQARACVDNEAKKRLFEKKKNMTGKRPDDYVPLIIDARIFPDYINKEV